jgi:hypothetical protein
MIDLLIESALRQINDWQGGRALAGRAVRSDSLLHHGKRRSSSAIYLGPAG